MIQYTCDRCRTPIDGTPVNYTSVHEMAHPMTRMSEAVGLLIPEKSEKGFRLSLKHLCGHCLSTLEEWLKAGRTMGQMSVHSQ